MSVLQDLPQIILNGQLVCIQPNSLSHQEGEIVYMLVGLDLKSVQQLLGHQLQHGLQLLKKHRFISLGSPWPVAAG